MADSHNRLRRLSWGDDVARELQRDGLRLGAWGRVERRDDQLGHLGRVAPSARKQISHAIWVAVLVVKNSRVSPCRSQRWAYVTAIGRGAGSM